MPGFDALVRRLAPEPVEARRRHVAVVLSSSDSMRADTLGHLDVFDTTQRTIRVSSADAADRLADTLAELRTMQPIPDAVLIARGGGQPPELERLASQEVRREIERLRARGTFVVVALGHGDFHAELGANVHALAPTSGALEALVRRCRSERVKLLVGHVVSERGL